MYKISIFLLLTSFIISCDVINPEEQIPTYVKIDNIRVLDKHQNPVTSKVTSASLSYGNSNSISLVGVFRLPMITPVLANEDGDLFILPGVDTDGRISQSYKYPFYKLVKDTIEYKPGDTIDYGTVTCYLIDTFEAKLNDGFENGSSFHVEGPDSAASTTIQSQIVSSGNQALELKLSDPQDVAYYTSDIQLSLRYNKSTFLEFDYYSEADFGVVLFYLDQQTQNYQEFNLLGVRGKGEWNKLYVNLTDEVNYLGPTNLRVGFKLLRNDAPEVKVYLDNVKFISEL